MVLTEALEYSFHFPWQNNTHAIMRKAIFQASLNNRIILDIWNCDHNRTKRPGSCVTSFCFQRKVSGWVI
jgi:hypothetical protein